MHYAENPKVASILQPGTLQVRAYVLYCSDYVCTRIIHIIMCELYVVVIDVWLITLGAHACSEGYCSCPVCVCMSKICCLTHLNHKREIPTDSLQYGNHFKFSRFLFKCFIQRL